MKNCGIKKKNNKHDVLKPTYIRKPRLMEAKTGYTLRIYILVQS